ncbi:MAG: hypothetical protein DSZ06_01735 [Sulfurospirillum sp.]|nr:MAG: hypothetical protein DSZ06_01735 [Sulfurospirillum sp.]
MIPKKLKDISKNPKFQESLKSLKPKKSIWGFLSVILLFIVPEIVAFIYGDEIKKFFELKLQNNPPYLEGYLYENMIDLFSEGSWINLLIGFGFLLWLFF